jgi:deoxyribose-phosphate aldolase
MSSPSTLRRLAQRLLPLLDLTGVEIEEAGVRRLCARARTPAGNVAALCVPPRFVPLAKDLLKGSAVPVSALAAMPPDDPAALVVAGLDEIDLALPFDLLRDGDRAAVAALVASARAAGGRKVLVKVILETGLLADPASIRRAAEAAIEGGADMLVMASERAQPGASAEAAAILLRLIAEWQRRHRWIGFKAAGGIRTLSDAQPYLALYDRVLGEGAASAAGFRIGGDALLNDVLLALGLPVED